MKKTLLAAALLLTSLSANAWENPYAVTYPQQQESATSLAQRLYGTQQQQEQRRSTERTNSELRSIGSTLNQIQQQQNSRPYNPYLGR